MSELAVIIPTLNELRRLPALLAALRRPGRLQCEIIVADGGSADGTVQCARSSGARVVVSNPGRARQMNAAARDSRAEYFLFLHADCQLQPADALEYALRTLQHAQRQAGHSRVAGHFRLHFERSSQAAHRLGYRYMEEKSALNRPYCQNGDQGLLIAAGYFHELGGFDESLPFFEDLRLAERIHASGTWITLPGVMVSSARRFEQEGWLARYRLMGLMVAAHGMGLHEFFQRAPALYAPRSGGKLRLTPYLNLLRQLARERGVRETWRHLLQLGHFSRQHWWQLFFLGDVALRRWLGAGRYPLLRFYDRIVYPLTANRAGDVFTAGLAWLYAMVWLRLTFRLRDATTR